MAETNLTEQFIRAQSIDFVEVYGKQLRSLFTMLGLQRKIPMSAGTTIKTYTSSVTLNGEAVAKGAVIPLSEVALEDGPTQELTFAKHRKAVAVEDVQKYGFQQAVVLTDEALLRELQKDLRGKLFAQLETGTGTATGVGLQSALAQAWGKVQVAFEDDAVRTIAFVNPEDVADYLANASITVQTAFGLNYVENFLGVSVVILTSQITKGTLYATAAENLVFAYANVAGGEIDKAFDFTLDQTGVIGVTRDVDKTRLTAETTTLSATLLFAERLDGIIKVTITAADSAPVEDPVTPESSAKPVINPVKVGDTTITGTGVNGSTITVTLPDETELTATVENGNWSVDIPEGKPVAKDDVIKATQTETGKAPTNADEVTVTEIEGA